MKILVICSENYSTDDSPLARTVGNIVCAYRRLGVEVWGFSPFFFKFADENNYKQHKNLTEKLGTRKYSVLKNASNEDNLFIRYDDYFARAGIYGNPGERAYGDNHLRFSFLASAALNYCVEMNFKPDAIHVHEWSGIAGALTKTVYKDYFVGTVVILTAHNIGFDYHFSPNDIPKIGLPQEGFDIEGYEFWGKVSMLKVAMLYSDKVVFTSASYLFHLLSEDSQGGMRGFLESHRKKLFSIQSGVDYDCWGIPKEVEHFFKKQKKNALRTELGLATNSSMLLYSHIDSYSDYSAQVISTILANLLNLNLQLVIGISENNANYSYFCTVQEKHRDKIALLPLYDNEKSLQQRLVASDLFLSINPSEPSLSIFLKAFATGSILISHKQSQKPFIYVMPFDSNSEENHLKANAFISEDASPDLILEQISIAESIFCEKKSLWSKLVNNAASVSVPWEKTAKSYLLLLDNNS
jgi:starch synthase